jgi:hypothetical protein
VGLAVVGSVRNWRVQRGIRIEGLGSLLSGDFMDVTNVLPTWPGHPVERVTLKHYTRCNNSQLQISTLKADYMILWYLSIKYILLDIFISSRNILGCDNMDIYIYIARAERIFGNTGK